MKVLTSQERLHRCYYHQETDRPGIYIRWGGIDVNNDPTYQELKKRVLADTDLKVIYPAHRHKKIPQFSIRRENYDENFFREIYTLATPAGILEKTSLLGKHGQPGLHETYLLKDEGDVEKYLSLPLPEITGNVDDFFSMRQRLGERGIVETSFDTSPGGVVAELFGSENFAIMSILNREAVCLLLERECECSMRLIKYLLEHGVGPYFSTEGQEYIVPPLHGRQDFFDFNVRYCRPLTDLIHERGYRVHVHSHGSVKTVLDGFIELGADVLHPLEAPPMGDITPREAKTVLRGKVTMEGNLQIANMYENTSDDIRMQTEALIRDTFDDHRGLIVCPTASPYLVLEGEKCTANYMTMIDTVVKWK